MSTPFYDLASLVVVPSGYKSGKIYAQKPLTTDGQLTFSRASTATRVNASGLVETVASNVPRLDYLGTTGAGASASCPSLLLEPQRTNLALYSESFDNAAWTKAGATLPVVTANTAISPDGYQNADRLQFASIATDALVSQLVAHTSGVQMTISGYIKSNTIGNQSFRLFGDFGTAGARSSTLTATPNWQRFTYTFTATATGNRSTGILNVANTASDLLLYGLQVEAGSYATSYIPTLGAAVTRGADNNVQVNPSTLVGATTGSWFMDVADYEFEIKGTTLGTSWIGDSESNFIGFLARTAGYNGLIFAKRESGTATIIHQTASKTLKACFTWNGSSLKLFVNGTNVYDNNSFANFAAWDTFQLNYATREASYKLNQTLLFPTALSDAEAIALTA